MKRRTKKVPATPKSGAKEHADGPSTLVERAVRSDSRGAPHRRTIVVGVGASAGGLEAFSKLLRALGDDPGMAVVFVQHLAPQHESALPTLLGHQTKLSVVQVTDGMLVEPNRVYVIPPNVQMAITDGELHLASRPDDRTRYSPIDFFFRSLAESAQTRAIGVILSGTASDGAIGIHDIKSAGGITIVQNPDTAKYDGMPRAAIATGQADLIMSPEEIGAKLRTLGQHPYVALARSETAGRDNPPTVSDTHLDRVFELLLPLSGVDFKHYKTPTIRRRLLRRMALQRITDVDEYIRYLSNNPNETRSLYQDILIHVTRFFREPDSFKALATEVLPKIMENRSADLPVRVWVAGCATGEEAYSIAIAFAELEPTPRSAFPPVQIFATDISDSAIEFARAGAYPTTITSDVSPDRLRRFFTKVDGTYRVTKSIRDQCVFARQDLNRDPPFSRLDLIFCRNVMIYLDATLQSKLLSVFHYALKPNGYLVLGQAETIGMLGDLFSLEDKKHRFYRKKGSELRANLPVVQEHRSEANPRSRLAGGLESQGEGISLQNEANQIILSKYAPPAVVVDSELRIVQFRGQTGPYLEPAPGEASLSLLKMAREGLLFGLRTAIQASRKSKKPVRKDGLRVRSNGEWTSVSIEVIPLMAPGRGHLLIVFEPQTPSKVAPARGQDAGRRAEPGRARKEGVRRTLRLQRELVATREYLQSIIQEVEAANEELQSANEEILSSNEELQSTNEELNTAKEELQSTNEELNTVNDELHARNEELGRVNSDLVNLLGSVQIAVVIVSSDLRIRRFTPMAERVLNLIPTDVGRPIGQINPNLDGVDLSRLISESVDRLSPIEREVSDSRGRWYSIRVRPYKNVENRIDGAVLTLFDIDAAKRQEQSVAHARDFAEAIVEAVREPIAILDDQLVVRTVNGAFREAFDISDEVATGKMLKELKLTLPTHEVEQLLTESLSQNRSFTDSRVVDKSSGSPRTFLVNVRPVKWETSGERFVLLTCVENTNSGRRA